MTEREDDNLEEEVRRRRGRWLHWHAERVKNAPPETVGARRRSPCPCCGCLTIQKRGDWELCPVCMWVDDGQGDADAHEVKDGPNGALSLAEARKNFQCFAACSEKHIPHVRSPRPEERP